ncbi:MAG: glycosyltransferase family 4 protein [Fibrobacter sp.]|jgi:glycosyltransferase involved in cell wall biosynthesis|nr:glycosyltransferase family 4 protein [Fibrobacter sp.]
MKTLVLNYEYPPIGGGGGRVSEQIAIRLGSRGHEVRVLTSRCRGIPAFEEYGNVKVKRIFSFRRKPDRCGVFGMAGYIIAGIIPAVMMCLRWKPDLIHAHFAVPSGALAYLVSILTRTPYILTAHLGDVPGCIPDQTDRLFFFFKPFTYAIWKKARAVTTVSGFVRNMALKTYDVPVVVIPNGIDLKSAQQLSCQGKKAGKPVKLVFSGRFNPQKNVLLICELLRVTRDYEWEMHFVGDGQLMADVRSKIDEYDLNDRTFFHGWVEPSEAEKISASCDILLIPSLVEGMPVAVLNGMALGLAVLGSDIEPLRDLITDGVNGFLCDVFSADSLAAKMKMLLENSEMLEEIKENNRRASENYDWERIVTMYEEVLRRSVKDSRVEL